MSSCNSCCRCESSQDNVGIIEFMIFHWDSSDILLYKKEHSNTFFLMKNRRAKMV